MRIFGISMLCFWLSYFIVTGIGVLHTVFNVYVLNMKEVKENSILSEGYEKTKPWHPLYNVVLFSLFGWIYMNSLAQPSLKDAFITGLIWVAICIVIDLFGWVLIKHPWSLSLKEFYVDYQPWISFIYLAIFMGPLVGYWFVLQ